MVTMMIISSISQMYYLNHHLEKEVQVSNNRLLTQVQISIDKHMVDEVHKIISDNFINLNQTPYMSDFFSNKKLASQFTLIDLHQHLIRLKSSNKYLDSIYIYRRRGDTLLSTREGLIYNVSEEDNPYRPMVNWPLLQQTMKSNSNGVWVSPKENTSYQAEEPILSYAFPIAPFGPNQENVGCVIVNINQDIFLEYFHNIYNTSNGYMMIIDSGDKVIAHSDSQRIYDPIESFFEDTELQSFKEQNTGFLTSSMNKHETISWVSSSLNDWKYIFIIPLTTFNKQLYVVKQAVYLLLASVIFLSLIGARFITSYLYRPLKSLITSTKEQDFITSTGYDDLSYINQVIAHLATKIDDMNGILDKNKGILEYKLALDLLYNKVINLDELTKRLQLIQKDFTCDHYLIIVIEFNLDMFDQLPMEQKEFVTSKTIEVLDDSFNDTAICINVCHPSNRIITLLNYNHYTTIQERLNEIRDWVESDFGLKYSIAVSGETDNIHELSQLYELTTGYFKYNFIYGSNQIYTSAFINRIEEKEMDFGANQLSNFKTFLKSCKIEQLKYEIESIITHIKTEGNSYENTQHILLEIARFICTETRNKSSPTTTNAQSLNELFKDIQSIDAFQEWIFLVINQYEVHIKERNQNIDSLYIHKICHYIKENIDQEISLNSVANEFNISSGHLSRIFKESTDTGFSEYVKELKLEKASDMLIQYKDQDITAIADKLGYLTPSYFSKLFKEKFGLTPTQYRKKYIHTH